MELAPDVERYRAIEAEGGLLALIARDGARVVGYSVNFVAPHIHYMRVCVAYNDVLYVDQAHRATLGLRLMRATEEAARERGADLMLWHVKPETPLSTILQRKGYRVQDIVYSKEL